LQPMIQLGAQARHPRSRLRYTRESMPRRHVVNEKYVLAKFQGSE
jgi:hypothetical protein